jgi:hypothetical protein
MHIPKSQHLKQLLLLRIVESTGVGPLFRVLISAEQHVPPHNVAVIILVALVLMMNPMHLRTLKEEPHPARRSYAGMIEELTNRRAGDRIRRRAKRDFDWIPDGPIRNFFSKQGLNDFLEGPFDPDDESLDFANGMLTRAAQAELKLELRRLRSKLVVLHEQSIPAALSEKDGIGLLLAIRQWEPVAFRSQRRKVPSPSISSDKPRAALAIGLPLKPIRRSSAS